MGTLQLRRGTTTDKGSLKDGEIFIDKTKNCITVNIDETEKDFYEANIQNITYATLTALINSSGLIIGRRYRITDYASVHTIPRTSDINTPAVEPLIVTAIAVNKLAPEAYSASFPEDIIYYEVTSDQVVVPGCTKGYIYRRIDTAKNNDIPFDFRNVKFRRWQISPSSLDATGADHDYGRGTVVKKTNTTEIYIKLNDLGAQQFSNKSSWKKFEWTDLSYVSTTEGNWELNGNFWPVTVNTTSLYMDYKMFSTAPTISGVESSYTTIYNNIIKPELNNSSFDILSKCNSVFFGTIVYDNKIGRGFTDNTLNANNFYSNSLGNGFSRNSTGFSFNHNTFGNNCYLNTLTNFNDNIILGDFYCNVMGDVSLALSTQNNVIGLGFNLNFVGRAFAYNSIGYNCNENCIGKDFQYNTIGQSFEHHSISEGFNHNTVGSGFGYCTISSFFRYNRIEDFFSDENTSVDFTDATAVYGNYNCTLFRGEDMGIQKLFYYNAQGSLTVIGANE